MNPLLGQTSSRELYVTIHSFIPIYISSIYHVFILIFIPVLLHPYSSHPFLRADANPHAYM